MKASSKSLYVFFSLLLLGTVVNAQQNNTLFFMHDAPQSNLVNPALPINCELFISAPLIGSTHINLYNTALSMDDFFTSIGNDSILPDFNNGVSKLKGLDIFAHETHISLFSAGYRHNDTYYTFSITEKINSHTLVPEKLAKLVWNGNTPIVGEKVDLSNAGVNFVHLREYSFGISDNINQRLRLGGKIKLLFGKSNVYTQNFESSIYTEERAFETNLNLDANINLSLPVDVSVDSTGVLSGVKLKDNISSVDYMLNRKNTGVAMDMGFVYDLNDNIQLSGSLLNLGFIRWKSDVHNFPSSGSLDFTGSGNASDFNSEQLISGWVDTVLSVFGVRPEQNRYISPLVPEIYLGATMQMNNWLNSGVLVHSQIYRNRLHPSLTVSGNASVTKNFAASLSYTLQNNEFNNVGAGMSLKLGGIQLHAVSDNIPGLIWFENTRNINVRFGISMLFGCPKDGRGDEDCDCVGDPYGEQRGNVRPGRR